MKPHIREFCDWLESESVEVVAVEHGGKHPRIVMRYQGRERFYILPATPSDLRGFANGKATVRQMLGLPKPRKAPKRRKVHRPKPRPSRIPLDQCPGLTLKADPAAALKGHPSYSVVLRRRLDDAWVRFWRANALETSNRISLL